MRWLPFVFGAGSRALPITALLTAVALFAIGATLSLFTGRAAVALLLDLGHKAGVIPQDPRVEFV